MKINVQKIAYRAIPVLTAFVILVASVAVPSYAVDEWTIIDYNDYAVHVEVDGDNDVVTLQFPNELIATSTDDKRGFVTHPGELTGYLYVDPAVGRAFTNVYCPGSWGTLTMLDASNIPNGSKAWMACTLTLETPEDAFSGTIEAGVAYFDENYTDVYPPTLQVIEEFSLDSELYTHSWNGYVQVNKPSNAKYLVFYVTCELNLDNWRSDYTTIPIGYEFDVAKLQMSISSLYRLQEETGNTNDLLTDFINGTPGQSSAVDGAVGDMNNAAGELGALGDQLAGVDKPDMDSVDVSIESLVDYPTLVAYAAPIQALWENPTLLGMLMIVVTLVIVSWVFFGKKV